MPAPSTSAISTVASCENRLNAARRSCGAPNHTSAASVASPPIHSDADAMCTQSASSVVHDDPASTRVVAREREPADEDDREHERGHEERDAVEQPREVDEREHEREPERHHDERRPNRVAAIGERSP